MEQQVKQVAAGANGNAVTEPQPEELAKQQSMLRTALEIEEQAKGLRIVDESSANHVAEVLRADLEFADAVDNWFERLKRPFLDKLQLLRENHNEIKGPLKRATDALNNALKQWSALQKRIKAEQDRLAKLKAEEEAKAAATELARQAQQAGASPEVVQSIIETAPVVPSFTPPKAQISMPKGITPREEWYAEIPGYAQGDMTAFMELIKAVAEGRAEVGLLLPNWSELNRRATRMKSTFNVPGVVALKEDDITVRRKR